MAQQEKLGHTVVSGPSKFDSSAALFSGDVRGRWVKFGLTQTADTVRKFGTWSFANDRRGFLYKKREFAGYIESVAHCDGSGGTWLIEGRIDYGGQIVPFSGNYSTQSRTGHFTLTFE